MPPALPVDPLTQSVLHKYRAVKDDVILKARSRGLVFYAAEYPDRLFGCEKLRLKAGRGGEGRTREGSQKPRRSRLQQKQLEGEGRRGRGKRGHVGASGSV